MKPFVPFCYFLFFLLVGLGCKNQPAKLAKAKPPKSVLPNIPPSQAEKIQIDIGHEVDELDGIPVYYNGTTSNTSGRNYSSDGYNYGLKWQCVEFVKRYYHQRLTHKMPNPWGHAKDFFHPQLKDGAFNLDRGLYQFKNGSANRIQKNDLLVFGGHRSNRFGHVAIVAKVTDNAIEIVQQNVGIDSRMTLAINPRKGYCFVKNPQVLGWLGKRK